MDIDGYSNTGQFMRPCRRHYGNVWLLLLRNFVLAHLSRRLSLIQTNLKTSICASAAVMDYRAPFFAARITETVFLFSCQIVKIHWC